MDDPLSSVEIDTTETAPAADDDRQTLQAADDARPLDEGSGLQAADPVLLDAPWIVVANRWFKEFNMSLPPNYVEGNPGPYIQDLPLAPIIATPGRLRGLRVADDRLWDRVEKQCENLSAEEWVEVRRADRREYDALRAERPSGKSGRRLNDRPRGGHFVAVDSEGTVIGHTRTTKKVKGKTETVEKFDQRTILWMAGGADGYENKYIEDKTGAGFTSEQIFDYLLSLSREFAARGSNGKQPIFISFGFSYDVGQIVKDFPYEKGWEVHNGKPFSRVQEP